MNKETTKTTLDCEKEVKFYEEVFPGKITVSENSKDSKDSKASVIETEYRTLKEALASAATQYDTYELDGTVYSDVTVINKNIKIVGADASKNQDYEFEYLFAGNFVIESSTFIIENINARYIFDGKDGRVLFIAARSGLRLSDNICEIGINNYSIIMGGLNKLSVNNSRSLEGDSNGGDGVLARVTATATSEITFNGNNGYGLKGTLTLLGPEETSPVFTNRNEVTIANNTGTDLIFEVGSAGTFSFTDSDVTADSIVIEGAESLTIMTENSSFKVGDKTLFDTSATGTITISNDDIN